MSYGACAVMFLIGVALWIAADRLHDATLAPWLSPSVIHIVGSGLVAGGLSGVFRVFRPPVEKPSA